MTDSATTAPTGAPLAGRSVVVTRTREQSRALAAPLEALGAEVIACPVIAIVDPPDTGPIDDAIAHLGEYDWIVLTSTNAVERFLARIETLGHDTAELAHNRIAAVGDATARLLEARGVSVAFAPPKEFRAESLVDEFVARGAGPEWRVLVPRALEAREILPDALRERGVTVDVAPVYRTVAAEPDGGVVERLRAGVDAVTFTSPSTVRNFLALVGAAGLEAAELLDGVVLASIGPVTTDALIEAGLRADVEADPSTVPSLVDALAARLGEAGADAADGTGGYAKDADAARTADVPPGMAPGSRPSQPRHGSRTSARKQRRRWIIGGALVAIAVAAAVAGWLAWDAAGQAKAPEQLLVILATETEDGSSVAAGAFLAQRGMTGIRAVDVMQGRAIPGSAEPTFRDAFAVGGAQIVADAVGRESENGEAPEWLVLEDEAWADVIDEVGGVRLQLTAATEVFTGERLVEIEPGTRVYSGGDAVAIGMAMEYLAKPDRVPVQDALAEAVGGGLADADATVIGARAAGAATSSISDDQVRRFLGE